VVRLILRGGTAWLMASRAEDSSRGWRRQSGELLTPSSSTDVKQARKSHWNFHNGKRFVWFVDKLSANCNGLPVGSIR
jgi:hypothetical protein